MELLSTIIQTLTSILAVLISVVTLLYTNKTERDANRPYLVVYTESLNLDGHRCIYLIIQNFGKSGAYIKNVQSSPSIKSKLVKGNNPFSNFSNQLIAPNQSYKSCIYVSKVRELELKTAKFKIQVDFQDFSGKKIKNYFDINLNSLDDMMMMNIAPSNAKGIEKAIYAAHSDNVSNQL